ncbi:MAG: 3'(2'),5'-bisphosphate nucleotidase [Deltaproteobacteria bacterium]|nr:MAG: 3'(2'),5'-bisphosphate nucleotidase [Deltaproteobacteria bacterium]
MSYEREKHVAFEAALSAAKLCEQVRQEIGPKSIEKKDGTPVTVADFGAQAVICRTIAEAFPGDQVVGEEDGATLREPAMGGTLENVTEYVQRIIPDATQGTVITWINRGKGDVGPRYWAIDPIDGTKGFLRGDQYAVAVALVEEGRVKLGVLACPSLPINPEDDGGEKGVLFAAVRGQGANMFSITGSQPCAIGVASPDHMADLPFVESVESAHCDHPKQLAVAQAVGIQAPSLKVDGQAKYGIVARGEALLYLRFPSSLSPTYLEKIWDHAAGAIIVEEAGGCVTDMQGRPLNFSQGPDMIDNQGIIAGNLSIHEKVLEVLKLRVY